MQLQAELPTVPCLSLSACFHPGQLPLQPPACSTLMAPPAVGSWHPVTTSLDLTRVCSTSGFCTVWPPLPRPCLGLGAFSLAMLGLEAHNKCFWINNNIYHSNKEKEMLFTLYVTQKFPKLPAEFLSRSAHQACGPRKKSGSSPSLSFYRRFCGPKETESPNHLACYLLKECSVFSENSLQHSKM